ncbi:AraC family transcriptional regulator [Paenibacillus piri]|nr:AraC family transcriptional regulator [Paenibacillus piri]
MRYHRSFLYRLIIFCLALSVIPVIFLGAFSFWKSSSLIQEKVDDGSHHLLLQTQMRMEQVLKTIDHSVSQFIGSPLAYASMGQKLDISEFSTVDLLKSQLHSIQTFELGIKDILLVNIDKMWSISNDGLVRYGSREDMKALLPYGKLPHVSSWGFDIRINEGTEPREIVLVKKLPMNSLTPQGFIVTSVSVADLTKLMGQKSDFGTIYIIDEQFKVLAASDGSSQGGSLFNDKQSGELRGSSGHFTTKFGTDGVAVTYQKSDFNNWTYVSVVPLDQALMDARSIGWLTLVTCLVILVIVVLLSLGGARKIYFPILNLYQSVKDNDQEMVSGSKTDEIHFIKDRILMLKRSNMQLLNQVQVQSKDLENFFLMNLLQGRLKDREIRSKTEQYRYNLNVSWMCVCTVQIDSLENTRYGEQDKDLLLFAVNNIAVELLHEEARIASLPFEKYQVTIMGGMDGSQEQFMAGVNEQITHIQQIIAQVLDLKVSIGVSRSYTDFMYTPAAFKESLEALSYRVRLGQGAVLNIADIEPAYPVKLMFPESLAQEIAEMIKGGEVEEAYRLVDMFVDEILNRHLSSREYQMYLVQLLMDLSRPVQRKGLPFVPLYGKANLFAQLLELQTAEEIKAWFKHVIIAPIFELLEANREEHYKQLCEEVIRIVHEHIHENITLDSCSHLIHYHPDYVGRVFRKHIGINFSDYVSRLRLQLAKQMLAETNLKISEVSSRLGYNSSQNFIRYFRKLEGITPGKFREDHWDRQIRKHV